MEIFKYYATASESLSPFITLLMVSDKGVERNPWRMLAY